MTGDIDIITDTLQSDLGNFKNWCNKNQLTMNIKKTKYYVVYGLKSQTRKLKDHQLFIQDDKLERVSSYKYLGITLDMNLNFNKHLENCIKLISHKAYLLSKIRQYINESTAVTIYKTMVLPIIEYGNILYEGANQKALSDLQTAQNRILRICLQENRLANVVLLHQRCKISELKERRLMHLNLFMYKQKKNAKNSK